MTHTSYDLVIIGSGPGGYVAGIRASQLGLSVAVIEKDKPGGICLNMGCIPTKSLIHHASLARSAKELTAMGYHVDAGEFRYEYVHKQSRLAADRLSKGVHYLLKKNKVDLIQARGQLISPGRIRLFPSAQELKAKNIIIAAGASPRTVPGFPVDEKDILTSRGALSLTKLPGSLLILGAGAIGIEFAYIFNAFGVKVCLVEILDQILPGEDEELAAGLLRSLKKQGIKVKTGVRAVSYEKKAGLYNVMLETCEGKGHEPGKGAGSIEVEKILLAVGRKPDTMNLGLEGPGIEMENGFIRIDEHYETSVPGVFAIGDVVNTPQLAHVASKEGELAVEYIAGIKEPGSINPDCIPRVVYCEPEAAGFGKTEQDLRAQNVSYKKIVFPYKGIGKATTIGKTDGFVKILCTPDRKEIISASILGHHASELIHEILLGKKARLTPGDIARMIHAHPTFSESIMEVMRGADDWMIHA